MFVVVVVVSAGVVLCLVFCPLFWTAGLQRGGRSQAGTSGRAVRGQRRRRERLQGERFQERGGSPEEAWNAHH